MANISGPAFIGTSDLYQSTTTQGAELGQFVLGPNGKGYRYCLAGELLVTGNMTQSKVANTQFDSMTLAVAGTIGDKVIYITNGTTALTVGNEFRDGSAVVSVTPGLGQEFTITGNSTAIASTGTIAVYLDRPLRVAMTIAASKVTLKYSPWYQVLQCPTTLTGVATGVAIYPIASGEYGWVQTKGVAGVLSDNSAGNIGSDVGVPGATAGCVGVNVAGSGKCNTIGRAMRALSTGVVIPVDLCID